jgi:hypothetical protein
MDERWLNCSFSDDFFACPLFSFSLLWYHSMAPDLLYKAFGLNATINARVCSIERSLDTIDKAIDNLELSIQQRNRGQATKSLPVKEYTYSFRLRPFSSREGTVKIGDRQNQPFSTLLNLTRNYIFASGGQGVKREVGKLGKRGELE